MTVKELITERHGEIRYTIGDGCSGGSIKQLAIASEGAARVAGDAVSRGSRE
ncbi:MAG TPA: DUF6351 family protein [Vicinamibacterales bacterium]|nr:DUF6351 family protein [Vicinamibacterales bacterium]